MANCSPPMLTVSIAEPKQAKLSLQEKVILCFLFGKQWCSIGDVSWAVAVGFNRHNNDKIWDKHECKLEMADECSKELTRLVFPLLDAIHKKPKLLTATHRASFSRSVKRLKARGLIECNGYYRIRLIKLTDAGRAYFEAREAHP